MKRCLAAALLGSVVLAAAPSIAAGVPVAISSEAGLPHIQPVTFGDLPASGARRRGRKSRDNGKAKPTEPLAKAPEGETEEQHKAYLKRYGF